MTTINTAMYGRPGEGTWNVAVSSQVDLFETSRSDHVSDLTNRLAAWELGAKRTSAALVVKVNREILDHRRSRTRPCREWEATSMRHVSHHPMVAKVFKSLWEKTAAFLRKIDEARPTWQIMVTIDTALIESCGQSINARLLFAAHRASLPSVRSAFARLVEAEHQGDTLLADLDKCSLVRAERVRKYVSEACDNRVDEILSPPEHLRSQWKPVARHRKIRSDDARLDMWGTHVRVRDVVNPAACETEVKIAFGPEASLLSHSHRRLPYECGSHKYVICEDDPLVRDATTKGFYMMTGPSGTAYRALCAWLALGGCPQQLPALRFALAARLVEERHHSLFEVMLVAAHVLERPVPGSVREMLEDLFNVPLRLSDGNAAEDACFHRMALEALADQQGFD